MKRAAVAVLTALTSCTPAKSPSPALDGGWRELTSEHFVLTTDLDVDDATDVVVELERLYHAFARVAFPHEPRLESVSHVTSFANEDEWASLDPDASAYFLDETLFQPSAIVTHGEPDRRFFEILAHELTHRFVAFYFPSAPTWLNEGLAEYFETIRFDGSELLVGEPKVDATFTTAKDATRWAQTGSRPPYLIISLADAPSIPALREMTQRAFYGGDAASDDSALVETIHYATAWGLVHTLRHGSADTRARFRRFLEELHVADVAPDAAWRRSFGSLGNDRLQELFDQHTTATTMTAERLAFVAPSPPAISMRALREAEALVVRANARHGRTLAQRRLAVADIERAARLDADLVPAQVAKALLLRAEGERERAVARLRGLVARSPTSPLALHALAVLISRETPDDERELDRIVARLSRVARSGQELNTVADHLVRRGRPLAALRYAARGAAADPSCWLCFATAGEAYALRGQWRRAAVVTATAINLAPEGARSSDTFAAVQAALVHYRTQASDLAGPP